MEVAPKLLAKEAKLFILVKGKSDIMNS